MPPNRTIEFQDEEAVKQHDIALFQPHPTPDDSPICFLPLPLGLAQQEQLVCCGQVVCLACGQATRENQMAHKQIGDVCPFCKVVTSTSQETYRVESS
jgi:hypothetical protein